MFTNSSPAAYSSKNLGFLCMFYNVNNIMFTVYHKYHSYGFSIARFFKPEQQGKKEIWSPAHQVIYQIPHGTPFL